MSKPVSLPERFMQRHLRVFGVFWFITFMLYLPAVKAGMVGDFAGWLYTVRYSSFSDYVNRPDSLSLYQFTQLVTLAYYKIFGINPWAWHILNVTLHAVNCQILFVISRKLFEDSHIRNAPIIALGGVLLYCFTPSNTEVIVHEPCFHYLLSFLILLSIVRLVQKFHHQQHKKYVWLALLLYLPSTYSLELFYITPWFILALSVYYRVVLHYDKAIFKKVILWFFVPLLVIFGAYEVVLNLVIHVQIAHVGIFFNKYGYSYLTKPPKYLFHLLFLGRYFSFDTRQAIYSFCESIAGLSIFYGLVVLAFVLFFARVNKVGMKAKAAVLIFTWALFTLSVVVPLEFPEMQLVLFDRYTYFMAPFVFLLLVLLLSSVGNKSIAILLFSAYAIVNICFTVKTNYYWKRSAYIVKRLINEIPDPGSRTIILLNPPENMNGILMLGSQPISVWKLCHNLYSDKKINNTVYDVASYNMVTPDDGAHVNVLNDSTITVTLNQWGTWWWYRYRGATSYENADYKLDMKDAGHWYQLTLKHPASQYLLLYQKGDQWLPVDWNKKNTEQY